jgi:hypothetical protein
MILLLVIIAINLSVYSSTLSLASAQRFLVQNNHDLQIAQEEICKSSIDIQSAKATLYPLIDFSGSFNYLTDFETAITNLTLAKLQVEQAKFNKRIAILNAVFVSGQELNFSEN